MDRVPYRTDGVTQISVLTRPSLVWILVGSMVMNCFSSTTILSFHRRKIFSGVRCTLQIIRGQGLPESISPQQTVEDTPKYFPHVVRVDLKISVALLLTEEKRKANVCLTAQIKH